MDTLVQLDNATYAFEFKLDQTAEIAIQQIKDKGYLEPYGNEGEPLIAISVNFSTGTKVLEDVFISLYSTQNKSEIIKSEIFRPSLVRK